MKTKKTQPQHTKDFDFYLNSLLGEAKKLFELSDSLGKKLIDFEQALREACIFFPFKFEVDVQKKKSVRKLENETDIEGDVYTYLSWEGAEDNPKNFRVHILIEQELSTVTRKTVSKRVLVECNLATRTKFLKYLIPFTQAYKNFIIEYANTVKEELNMKE